MKNTFSSLFTHSLVMCTMAIVLVSVSYSPAYAEDSYSPVIKSVHVTNVSSTRAVITVISNEPVTVQLSYKNQKNTNTYSTQSSTLQKQHIINLTGLSADTNFELYAIATNRYSRVTQSSTSYFSTPSIASGDVTDPVVSNIHTQSIETNKITLMWDTNEPTTGTVWYHIDSGEGVNSAYAGNYVTKNSGSMSMNHTVTIKNLQSGSRYKIIVGGSDSSGNIGQSVEQIVTTDLSGSNQTPVQISGTPIVYNLSVALRNKNKNRGAHFAWKTNEAADSSVIFSTSSDFMDNKRTAQKTGLVRNHEIHIGNLNSKTFYYYKVASKDSMGDMGTDTGVLYIQ